MNDATPKRGRPRAVPLPHLPEIERIRLARRSDPRTNREIALAAGISKASLQRILTSPGDPGFSRVRALLVALGLKWSDLE